jgi:bacillolysin/neutral peptidase B
MAGLRNVFFHVELDGEPPAIADADATRGPNPVAPAQLSLEEASREFLEGIVFDKLPSVRGPGKTLAQTEQFKPLATTRVAAKGGPTSTFVAFQQLHKTRPIFGARPTVECADGKPLAVSGQASDKPDKSPDATVTEADAIAIAARGTNAKPDKVELVYYYADDGWHLAYHVMGIEVAKTEAAALSAHGPGGSPRLDQNLRNVLVDAHDEKGKILLDYSATPLVAIEPIGVKAIDEEGVERVLFTKDVDGKVVELRDELNNAATYDHDDHDITVGIPETPLRETGDEWKAKHRAAASAHTNAVIVMDYFRSKLKRSGLDNNNMELASVVRSTYKRYDKPPVWRNAVWWKGAMWYGQDYDANNRLVSFATRIEIAAHEMTHGLIEKTANLMYRNESGALNESFADIFGILISNTHRVGSQNIDNWSWVIGKGLAADGKDIRDFKDPTRLNYPAHYNDRYVGTADEGGVHHNSNIHNRAAYNLLAAKDDNGPILTPDEVGLLYYLALLRLSPLSNFRDALQALMQATATLYKFRGAERRLTAIRQAYADVGIEA